jgi:hypothetical protein
MIRFIVFPFSVCLIWLVTQAATFDGLHVSQKRRGRPGPVRGGSLSPQRLHAVGSFTARAGRGSTIARWATSWSHEQVHSPSFGRRSVDRHHA